MEFACLKKNIQIWFSLIKYMLHKKSLTFVDTNIFDFRKDFSLIKCILYKMNIWYSDTIKALYYALLTKFNDIY